MEDCLPDCTRKLDIPKILAVLFALLVVAYIAFCFAYFPLKFLQLDEKLKAVIKLQVNGVHNYQRKEETLKETSLKIKKKFIRITGDNALNSLLKELTRQTKIYVESKRREAEINIKDKITGEKNEDFEYSDSFSNKQNPFDVLFDISPKVNTPTEFGFVGSFDNIATQIFIGSAPLIEYEKASIKIKQWKMFYPLPENSAIYEIGKTSSCLLKKKSSHTPNLSITSIQLCDIRKDNSETSSFTKLEYDKLHVPNRGESPTIHLENLCETKYNSRLTPNGIKKISYYSSTDEITNNKNTPNDVYIASLDYYNENQNKFDEIYIDGISCRSVDAPLSSPVFLFANKRGALTNVVKGMLKDIINDKNDQRKFGLIEHKKNWEEEEKRIYPSMNE